ncbi:hypothetical protein [Alteraurantiacibacter buctensis]|uniref:Uncharacterized protein n=1 Tax=Alteraurantiacibacter buctensis TaxID=1503981 RepID=A0A844Z387_9SPHN|nr:hypothetical protein [Alteraurantiacibacter buctensis]MXO73590.1 hypothetical protein [Alteraurantiacibacter buctensis]
MSDLAAIITAATGLLVALGGAIAWLWNKLENRFTAIEQRAEGCEERSAVQTTVIELLWQELERVTPDGSKVLARALKLLNDLKEPHR